MRQGRETDGDGSIVASSACGGCASAMQGASHRGLLYEFATRGQLILLGILGGPAVGDAAVFGLDVVACDEMSAMSEVR